MYLDFSCSDTAAFYRSDFTSEVLPSSTWHVGKWRAYCVFPATGSRREDEMTTDVSRQHCTMSHIHWQTNSWQTWSNAPPGRLFPPKNAIFAVSIPNASSSSFPVFVVYKPNMLSNTDEYCKRISLLIPHIQWHLNLPLLNLHVFQCNGHASDFARSLLRGDRLRSPWLLTTHFILFAIHQQNYTGSLDRTHLQNHLCVWDTVCQWWTVNDKQPCVNEMHRRTVAIMKGEISHWVTIMYM